MTIIGVYFLGVILCSILLLALIIRAEPDVVFLKQAIIVFIFSLLSWLGIILVIMNCLCDWIDQMNDVVIYTNKKNETH